MAERQVMCTIEGGECHNGSECVEFPISTENFCRCPTGYSGPLCDFYKGEYDDKGNEIICTQENDLCQNGGKCAVMPIEKENFCNCPSNTRGQRCHQVLQNDSTPTAPKPTDSGTTTSFSVCTESGNQCQNGGKCVVSTETVGGVERQANYCDCPPDTFGQLCHGTNQSGQGNNLAAEEKAKADAAAAAAAQEEPVCTKDGGQCLHGGFCVLATDDGKVPANYCVCPETHVGKYCGRNNPEYAHPTIPTQPPKTSTSTASTVCTKDGNECLNGASCVLQDLANNIPANYCKCVNGYFGAVCRGKHSNPPPNMSDSKAQICTSGGFECQNGGVCVLGSKQTDMSASNYCACPEGTSGDTCELVGACDLECLHGGSCRHGDGINHSNTGNDDTYCECDKGYKGKECEIPFTDCPIDSRGRQNQCLFGGECVYIDDLDGYGCDCPKGRSGENCEQGQISTLEDYNGPCFSDADCDNGGLCTRIHDAKTTAATGMNTKTTQCLCPLGWGGDNCESRCDSLNCQHGSSCRFADPDIDHANDSSSNGSYCACSESYKGRECEIAVNKCPGSNGMECLYGGTCIGSEEDTDRDFYTCACPPGRKGDQCEFADPTSGNASPSAGSIPSGVKPKPALKLSGKELDENILIVSMAVLVFLLFIPVTLCVLRKNRIKKELERERQEAALGDMGDKDIASDTNGESSVTTNGESSSSVETPNVDAVSEDIFDYDTEGVVNVNLDENEPVELPKDKQIV